VSDLRDLLIPRCPGCGQAAPPPHEAEGWEFLAHVDETGESYEAAVCPRCQDDETMKRLRLEHERRKAATGEPLALLGDKLRAIGDLTTEEQLIALAESHVRFIQTAAWARWVLYRRRALHPEVDSDETLERIEQIECAYAEAVRMVEEWERELEDDD
jgi:hypothetical protein